MRAILKLLNCDARKSQISFHQIFRLVHRKSDLYEKLDIVSHKQNFFHRASKFGHLYLLQEIVKAKDIPLAQLKVHLSMPDQT